jgi:hypothetical protein
MSREAHVQFYESLGVRFPGATHLVRHLRMRRAFVAGVMNMTPSSLSLCSYIWPDFPLMTHSPLSRLASSLCRFAFMHRRTMSCSFNVRD